MKPLSHLDSKNANLPLGLGLETLSLNPEGCTWKGTLHVEQCTHMGNFIYVRSKTMAITEML